MLTLALVPCVRVPVDTPTAAGSVLCNAKLECKLDAFHATDWSARATFIESNNQTGWSTLTVEAVDAEETADSVQAFAAGFIEGRLTANLIDLEWVNLQITISARAKKFVQENTQWVRSQIQAHPEDPYWVQVGLVIAQFDGLVAGYQSAPTWPQGNRSLTSFEILLIGMQPELGDVEKAVNPIARPDYSKMTPEALREYVYANSHCSAMIKVLPDLSELYSAHNTWTTFSDMGLRLWKVYKLPFATSAAQTVSFSGYAGKLAGIDDFYVTSQKLVVIETTNSVFNNSLFDSVTTSTVPYWVRVVVANQLAASSPAWHSVFYKFNSGTYNNQWMTVDYKLFTPKAPLPADLFWVSEQIPGYSAAADQTMALQRGHWPSYNVAFYADIYNMSGYPKIVQKFGSSESYQLAPRAPIFRRDADGMVHDLHSMKTFMRLNKYNSTPADPLFPTPESAIAARGDLMPKPRLAGAYDCKIASHELLSAHLSTTAIAGPSSDDQPVFSWDAFPMDQYPHYGHPPRFNFAWEIFAGTTPSQLKTEL